MKYVIMCGGVLDYFEEPRQLSIINGERLVERTIRLLKENNIKDIYISSLDPRFDEFGVPRLVHDNTYFIENGIRTGYWLNAFYPDFDLDTKVTYLFGDVYYTENAIKTIIECERTENILFGTSFAKWEGQLWGEPFAYKVNNYNEFITGIKAVKKLCDEGKCNRHPLVWELYRYLNNIDINTHKVLDTTYIGIDDGTCDIDSQDRLQTMKECVETGRRISVIIPTYNRKKLLKRAIDSIPKRCDTEIIVVDDASTEDIEIEESENLKVIRLDTHQGVSAARNAGIEAARGKYILFLDDDDYIITDNFYKMELWLNNIDILYFNLELNAGNIYALNEASREKWCGTTKFIKKQFLGDTRFPVGVNIGEDLIFTQALLKKNPTEFYSNIPLIHYNHPRIDI